MTDHKASDDPSPAGSPPPPDLSPLPQEEYVEQAHFFQVLVRQLRENMPAQEVLSSLREEILATTKLPLAIDFLLAELRHRGAFTEGMRQLGHYFTPFQCFVMGEAENDRRRFDMHVALEILSREAQYRAKSISRQGLFLYQFESLSRNRLGYDSGLTAMAADPSYDETWRDWILTVRRQIGIVELSDLIYVRSDYYHEHRAAHLGGARPAAAVAAAKGDASTVPFGPAKESPDSSPDTPEPAVLFGRREGRIAWANRRKDPLLLFSALHRQLGYPQVPRPKPADKEQRLLPALARRVEQLEARLKLVEEEQRGGIDLERFYVRPDKREP